MCISVRSTPVLPQWHVKDPGHSAKSAGGRLHLNTHTTLTQRSPGKVWEPIHKRAHTQLVKREQSYQHQQ